MKKFIQNKKQSEEGKKNSMKNKSALTFIPAAFPHRILLSMNGCLDTSETKGFLLIQVRFH